MSGGWSGGGSGSGGGRGVQCSSCGLYGHEKSNCDTKLCSRCKNTGHLAANCPVPVCPVCSGGHWKQNCPNAGPYKGKNTWGGPGSCSHCGSRSHVQKGCPEVQDYINKSK